MGDRSLLLHHVGQRQTGGDIGIDRLAIQTELPFQQPRRHIAAAYRQHRLQFGPAQGAQRPLHVAGGLVLDDENGP